MPPSASARTENSARDWVRLLRPGQWAKNFFVLTPLVFSGRVMERDAQLREVAAFVVFCLLASGVYVLNDVADRTADQAHPVKRQRPIPAGRIAPAPALAVSVLLLATALVLAWLIHPTVAVIGGAYLGLNLLYTFVLKRIVLLDVFAIAVFFILRLLAGAEAIQVVPSIWLLLCGGLLALYLGFTKRRHELLLLGEASAEHRSVLTEYSPELLDQMSTVLLSVTVVSYIMYTVSKYGELGSHALSYSTAFVLYGVFRYLYLVHQRDGGSPTETLLTDRSLIAAVVSWFIYCAWVIYRPF